MAQTRGATGRAKGTGLLDDPALLAPLLVALPAADVASASCVCKSWAAAERSDRNALFQALSRARWPGLVGQSAGAGRAVVDWRHRYKTLSRRGLSREPTVEEDEDPLANYSFIIQGQWGATLAFSRAAAVTRVEYSAVYGGHVMEFKDVVRYEVSLPEPVRLPPSWRVEAHEGEYDGLDISMLVQFQRGSIDQAAHLFDFSICKQALQAGPSALPPHRWWGSEELSGSYEASVDTLTYSTATGCGPLSIVGGKPSRADPPWLAKFDQGMPETSLITSRAR